MYEKVDTVEGGYRLTSRQQHRSNAEAQLSPEQFSPSAKVATSLLGLVPSVLSSRNVNLNAAGNTYTDELPSPQLYEI